MNDPQISSSDADVDSELDNVLAEALSRIDRGDAVDPDALAANYPEFADDIRAFLSLSQEVGLLMGACQLSSDNKSIIDEAQRSTTSIDDDTVPVLRELPYAEDAEPKRIGKYEIQKRLGSGSFGVVYLAFDALTNRQVAIKLPLPGQRMTDKQRAAFLHEARSAAILRHENIAVLHDVDTGNNGAVALIYEYVPGDSLYRVLKSGQFQRDEAVRWIAEVADALHYAHQRTIVHRDIKPSNILLEKIGDGLRPKVVDFGLALLDQQSAHDGEGHIVGSVAYMSPEQARGDSHWATAQSDIFSLGVILYEVLCRRSPWAGSSGSKALRDIQERHPSPPRVFDDSIPPELEQVCLRALAKSPRDRYTTAGDMARDLRAALTVRPTRRLRPMIAAIVAVAASLLAATGWIFLHAASPTAPPAPTQPLEIPRQEVRLTLRVQPSAKPGTPIVLDDSTDDLESSDGLQIHAQTKDGNPGYLYCIWCRPDGSVQVLPPTAAQQLSNPRPAIQQPSVGPQFAWDPIGRENEGENLVLAFTKSLPLTTAELDQLEHATWRTSHNRLDAANFVQVGEPQTNPETPGVSRGAGREHVSGSVAPDKYLGQLGTILRDQLKCYYQGVIFRVYSAGHRAHAQ